MTANSYEGNVGKIISAALQLLPDHGEARRCRRAADLHSDFLLQETDHMSAKWEQQLQRTKRYLQKFRQVNDGRPHDQHASNYDDVVITFFQHCYHVKDWIKNDPACGSWSSVESFINATLELAICADICNATKHLTLKTQRSGSTPQITGSHLQLNIGGEIPAISIKYEIDASDGPMDAFELAEKCVAAWDQFVANNI